MVRRCFPVAKIAGLVPKEKPRKSYIDAAIVRVPSESLNLSSSFVLLSFFLNFGCVVEQTFCRADPSYQFSPNFRPPFCVSFSCNLIPSLYILLCTFL